MTAEQKIRTLLTQQSADFACVPLSLTAGGPMPLRQAQSIYRLRAKRNEQSGSRIQGFPDLIAGLDKENADEVVIHCCQAAQTTFLVFTDIEVSKVIGILRFPDIARAQSAAVTYKTKAAPPIVERNNFTRSDTK